MARFSFSSIFTEHPDGSIEPIQTIKVGGIEISPGTILRPGVIIGGVDFTQFKGQDFEIETQGSILILKGIYGRPSTTQIP
jgi:hypothetical protein